MGYRSVETVMRWLRLALAACAALYLKDASRVIDSLTVYRAWERDGIAEGRTVHPSSAPDELQDWEHVALVVVLVLLVLFFERAYRNLPALPGGRGLLWRARGAGWRLVIASWALLLAIASVSIAVGNAVGRGPLTVDEAQLWRSLEASGEMLTAVAALLTAGVVSAISIRQARSAAELELLRQAD